MILRFEKFFGMYPRTAPHLLSPECAQKAINCRIASGALEPWWGTETIDTPTKEGVKKSVYLFKDKWLHWTEDVNVAVAALPSDTYDRLYFTGDTFEPQITTYSLATTGGTDYPVASFKLGVPAPTTAPSVAVINPGSNEVPVTLLARSTEGVITVTAAGHGLNNDTYRSKFSGLGLEALDGFAFKVDVASVDTFSLVGITSVLNKAISAVTRTNPAKVTSANHGLADGDKIKFSTPTGMTELNGVECYIKRLNLSQFQLYSDAGLTSSVNSNAYHIFTAGTFELVEASTTAVIDQAPTAITLANPGVVTLNNHNLRTGQVLMFYDMVGMTELEGYVGEVVVVDNSKFQLKGLDTTGYTAFVSGKYRGTAKFTYDIDPTTIETRAYVETFVSDFGEESMPSPASSAVDVAPGQPVAITDLNTFPVGRNITKRRIYRTVTGQDSTNYYLVVEQDATPTYTDTKKNAELEDALPSLTWAEPPSTLRGLISLPNGSLAGITDNELCLSVPYQPHAWPEENRYALESEPVAIGAYGMSVVIATKRRPFIATGSDPAALTIEAMELGHACVSKRGLVDAGMAIFYPSPVGLMMVGPGAIDVCTKDILSPREWATYCPETLTAFEYRGCYIGFFERSATDKGGFIYCPTTASFTELTIHATGGFYLAATGDLYLQVDDDIIQFDVDEDNPLTYRWLSKKIIFERHRNLSVCRVFAEEYPVTVILRNDGEEVAELEVEDNGVKRFPAGFMGSEIEVVVEGNTKVYVVILAEKLQEVQGAA